MLIGEDERDEEAGRHASQPSSGVLIGSSAPPSPSRQAVPPPSPVDGGGPASNSRRALPWVAGVGALVVIAALAAGLILSLLRVSDLNTVNSARSSALAAAKTYTIEVASYDYRHLTRNFGVVEAHSTASFKGTWSQSSQALIPVLTKYHATSVAQVVAAGVESASTNRVVVVLFVNQTVTNDTQRQATTDQSRLEMTLVHEHGHWLIDKLTLL
jgi:Mce-associated membrane protein